MGGKLTFQMHIKQMYFKYIKFSGGRNQPFKWTSNMHLGYTFFLLPQTPLWLGFVLALI